MYDFYSDLSIDFFAGRGMKVWLLREGQEPKVLVDVDDYDYNDPKPKRLVHMSHDSFHFKVPAFHCARVSTLPSRLHAAIEFHVVFECISAS